MPNLIKMIRDHKDLSRLTYLFATYRHYLKYKVDDKGTAFDIAEPWMSTDDKTLIKSDDPIDFLALSPFQSTDLKAANDFVKQYLLMVEAVKEKGAMSVLENILS